ncbi:hypothetical protein FHP29_01070 [Nocardioides albidus]|uniref:Uncharacterized protein n=1 Tax=Nocardioides albidus TaxID=1517589 RepID=A0A5C4WQD0_9ACTN|nr:hypothetical protein [Nocardioides albidus]TNM50153.1 hypothetical protein FHP29_01070 [Nocardioides albidus]
MLLRGPGPQGVAEDYLRASWTGRWRAMCEAATEQWRTYLFQGVPYADCAAYADADASAGRGSAFDPYREDTEITVSVEPFSEGDGRARVSYEVELRYHGADRAGFDAIWQGARPIDRGTVELVEVDGDWRVAGVDAG